jgi:hypothetical protein
VLTNGPSGFSGNGKLHVGADLAFVNSVVQAVSAGGQQVVAQSKAGEVRSGALDGTLGFDSASGKPTNLAGDFKIADLVVTTAGGGATQPETVTLALQATAPSDFATVSAPKVSVASRFANLNVTDAVLKLKDPSNPNAAVGTLDKLQKANVAVDVTDVGTLYTIAGAFMPPAAATTAPAAGQATPVEPLAVSGGHAKANVAIARDNGVTTLNVSDVSGGEIQLRRGSRSYTVQPFTAELAAAVKDSGDQIAQVDVSKLAAKSGVADVTMEQPISIRNPGADQMAATGALRVAGQIRPASDLLAVVQGKPLPYNGAYVMVQKLNTEGSTVGLAGNVDLTNFQVLDDQGQVSFAEDKVAVTNDLKIDQKAKNVAGSLNVDSKALGVKFNGGVNQFDTTRAIVDGTTLALNYDAAKVWQLVRPMLSPETQASLGDVQVTGVKQATFKLGGSYPADEPFQQAVAKLNASGALPLDTLEAKGIEAKQINPGFTLAGGKLTLTAGPGAATVTAAATSKPGAGGGGGPMVVTALVNGGSVDLTNAAVDLTTPEPRLSTPPNKALAHNVAMNSVLAEYANKVVPVFDTRNQSALADVTIVRCDKLPLGEAMTTPNNGGYAEVVVSLTNVRPGGPIIGGVDQFVGGFFGTSAQATVEPTTIVISDGVAKVNSFALAVGAQQHQTLKLDGTVSLADNGPLNLTANIPSDMIKRFGKDVLKYLPQGVDLPIGGTKDHPQFADADKVVASLAKQALTNAAAGALTGGKGGKNGKGGGGLGDILGNVLGGNDQNQPQAQPQQQQQQQKGQQQQQQAQPQPESPADAIGGLLNSLTQDRDSKSDSAKKDKKKKK